MALVVLAVVVLVRLDRQTMARQIPAVVAAAVKTYQLERVDQVS
jgi:hypothetical protein